MTNTEIAQKLHNALNIAENIAGEVEAYSVVRAFGYLEAHIEVIIEELEEMTNVRNQH